ncbi:MAG: type II toxin-antitoxin system RelE/ParE family toxin [Methanotrichaceae archaeon]
MLNDVLMRESLEEIWIDCLDMNFTLKILRPARKKLDKMNCDQSENIYDHLETLKIDPYTPHPGMDIIKIEGKTESVYRLRIGRWRVEYAVLKAEHEIWVARIFPRRRDSDYR